jgi:hypothetical protein
LAKNTLFAYDPPRLDYFVITPLDSNQSRAAQIEREKRRANYDVPRDPLIFTLQSKATKLNQNHAGKSLDRDGNMKDPPAVHLAKSVDE